MSYSIIGFEGSSLIKAWADVREIEEAALNQLRNVGSMPFIFKHVAVMPDVHYGLGATVGSVIATQKAIMPAAVGVDIGCGMRAVKTNLCANKVQDKISKIRKHIERSVPVGFEQHHESKAPGQSWGGWMHFYGDSSLFKKAICQMGTLGGGNHFIEVCLDTENNVWVMLHSGSRGIGNALAKIHIEAAKGVMKQMFIELPDPDLAYFAEHTPHFRAYMMDLEWCQSYAKQNRAEMMELSLNSISHALGMRGEPIERLMDIDCHHNYTERENHFGQNVWVTRKGAVRAREGDYGIIPGSLGAKSFIVKGKGNLDSFCSCSHGAGRKMSRGMARKSFTEEDLKAQTMGVECRKDSGVIDEIPGAYKDIDRVMAQQQDLVEVVAELKQIMCIKG